MAPGAYWGLWNKQLECSCVLFVAGFAKDCFTALLSSNYNAHWNVHCKTQVYKRINFILSPKLKKMCLKPL